MAYDEGAAQRIREILEDIQGITERKMFGGIAFMLYGNMCCGVLKEDLVLRLGEEGSNQALKEKHVRNMDFTGRPMKSMVYVSPEGYDDDDDLKKWVTRSVEFAQSLPKKKK